ncbi:hypothetical protein ACWA7J_19185 [Leptothrix sp. BB-4]
MSFVTSFTPNALEHARDGENSTAFGPAGQSPELNKSPNRRATDDPIRQISPPDQVVARPAPLKTISSRLMNVNLADAAAEKESHSGRPWQRPDRQHRHEDAEVRPG